ncbi:TlpA disulfide reductase family protein [Desulfovibrio piger]|uniref:TlpA family protein disulfide reductase n=1 Tax=Desulfovibrio piger TaxID=901 RepID=UPI0026F2D1E3|nr:TlpA disulfide reductase family protein [Desulfovibrio piger]
MKRFVLPLLLLALLLPCLAQAQDFKTVELKDLTAIVAQNKGKVVMLNFFATWCPPCREEIPFLVSLASRYEGKAVIVGLSVDEDAGALPAFLKQLKVNYPVYRASEDVIRAFNVRTIPHNVFYGKNSRLALMGSGMVSNKELTEIFDSLGEQK